MAAATGIAAKTNGSQKSPFTVPPAIRSAIVRSAITATTIIARAVTRVGLDVRGRRAITRIAMAQMG